MVEYHAIQGAQAKFSNLKKTSYIFTQNIRSRWQIICIVSVKLFFELLDIKYLNK